MTKYSMEIKRKFVEMVENQGYSIRSAAKEIGWALLAYKAWYIKRIYDHTL